MRLILALGILLLARPGAASALSLALSLFDRGAPEFTGLSDLDEPPFSGSAMRSRELPTALSGYDGSTRLLAWGWRPANVNGEQAETLSSWLAFGGRLVVGRGTLEGKVPAWLAALLPDDAAASDGPSADRCRRFGAGAVCIVSLDRSRARELVRPGPARTAAVWNAWPLLQSALRGARRMRNPAGPLFLFSTVYALSVAWLSWGWFRKRGIEDRAWLGVLGLTLLFSLAAIGAGRALTGGDRELQLSLLHGAPGTTRLRLTGWLARFSMDRGRWSAELPEGVESQESLSPGPPAFLKGGRLEGRSEPGETTGFSFRGERRLAGPLRANFIEDGTGSRIEWVNETGLEFDRLWLAGASPESGLAAPAGSRGALRLDAADGRSFPPPPAWTYEEGAFFAAYVGTESVGCPDCAFLAATLGAPGPEGRRLLYVWSVPGAHVPLTPPYRRFRGGSLQ